MIELIITMLFFLFLVLDLIAFAMTPTHVRCDYWWRYLPGGGIGVLFVHTFRRRR